MVTGIFHRINRQLRISAREFRVILFVSALFVTGSMIYVWSNVKMVKQAHEFQVLKRENQALLQQNRLFKLEKGSLQSLYRIQDLAQTKLGLQPAKNDQIVTVFLK